MQRFLIYLFLQIALHVTGGFFAHHQEHKSVHASFISSTIAAGSSIG
jgi:hypothetical protein